MHFKENDMSRAFTNSLAAFAAILLAAVSIGTIITVPPAHATSSVGMIELA